MAKNKKIDLDYDEIAENLTEFQAVEQKHIARLKLEEYLNELVKANPSLTGEIIRRINKDTVFKDKMLNSVIQFSCLLTSSIIETVFVYDKVFKVVKRKSLDDYNEVKEFKMYLLNTFSLEELEEEIGFKFSDESLNQFNIRFKEINDYFKNH